MHEIASGVSMRRSLNDCNARVIGAQHVRDMHDATDIDSRWNLIFQTIGNILSRDSVRADPAVLSHLLSGGKVMMIDIEGLKKGQCYDWAIALYSFEHDSFDFTMLDSKPRPRRTKQIGEQGMSKLKARVKELQDEHTGADEVQPLVVCWGTPEVPLFGAIDMCSVLKSCFDPFGAQKDDVVGPQHFSFSMDVLRYVFRIDTRLAHTATQDVKDQLVVLHRFLNRLVIAWP